MRFTSRRAVVHPWASRYRARRFDATACVRRGRLRRCLHCSTGRCVSLNQPRGRADRVCLGSCLVWPIGRPDGDPDGPHDRSEGDEAGPVRGHCHSWLGVHWMRIRPVDSPARGNARTSWARSDDGRRGGPVLPASRRRSQPAGGTHRNIRRRRFGGSDARPDRRGPVDCH